MPSLYRYILVLFFFKNPPAFSQETIVKTVDEYLPKICENIKAKDFNKVIAYGKQYRSACKKINYRRGEIKGLNAIGYGYAYLGDNNTALAYFDSVKYYSTQKEDKDVLYKLYGNRGLTLDSLHKHKEAMDSYEVAVKLCEQVKDYEYLASLYYALLRSFWRVKNLFNGKNYYDKENEAVVNYYSDKMWGITKKYHVKNNFLHYACCSIK